MNKNKNMSEIFKAVDNHVEKIAKDKFKAGLDQGVKQGQSGMLLFILVFAVGAYSFIKYTRDHTVSVNIESQQALGIKSELTNKDTGRLQTIPASEVNVVGNGSATLSADTNSIDTKLNANVSGTTTYQPKKGIFQPKNPNAQITLSK